MASAQVYDDGNLTGTTDWSAKSDQKGLWTGSQEFFCQRDNIGTLLPSIGASWSLFPWMYVTDREIIGEGGKMVRLRLTFEGANMDNASGGGGVPVPQYSLRVSLSEEPLTTHPRYSTLSKDDIIEAYTLATDPPRSEDGKSVLEISTTGWPALKIELYEKLQNGVEAYRDPKVSWVKKWVDDELPTNLNTIGEIGTPPGSPPAVAADRNWLFAGLQSDERGGVYELEETWELSGKGGWDENLYLD